MSISVFRGFLNKTNYLIDLLQPAACSRLLLHVTSGELEQLVELFVAVIKAEESNITRPPAGQMWNYTLSLFQTVSMAF